MKKREEVKRRCGEDEETKEKVREGKKVNGARISVVKTASGGETSG